jgi:hypothetical protein
MRSFNLCCLLFFRIQEHLWRALSPDKEYAAERDPSLANKYRNLDPSTLHSCKVLRESPMKTIAVVTQVPAQSRF